MKELLLESTALLVLWLCLSVWQRDATARGRRLFMGLCAAIFAWSLGGLVEAIGGLSPTAVDRITYAGVFAVPPLWLTLTTQMRGAPFASRTSWLLGALLAPPAAAYALLFSGDASAWFLAYDGQGVRITGPLWWVNAGYGWTLAALAFLQLVRAGIEQREARKRAGRIALAVASCAPAAANVVYVLHGIPGVDATPLLLAAILVALRSSLFSGDLLQALPLSQLDLVSQLPAPVILTDLADHVTEINPAAQLELGISKADALDRSLTAVLEDALGDPQLERWPILVGGREAGHILLIGSAKSGAGGSAS